MKLRFEGVTRYYGKQCVLEDFSTELTEGVFGLLGPNGSGKTTLISILTGILRADRGRILLEDIDVRQMGTDYLDRIGYLCQYPVFYKNFKIHEFLKYMCALKNIPGKQTKGRIEEVLELVNLTSDCDKKIFQLSGGMRQRLGIAQAIINRPDILILDEPTAGLDPAERIRFRNIVSRLSKNKTVFLATHIVSDIEYIAKEVLILKKGKLVMQGTPDKLCESMQGKVWQVPISEEKLAAWTEGYNVVNIKRTEREYMLRIICENSPEVQAAVVEPCLEDVFLSVFREA